MNGIISGRFGYLNLMIHIIVPIKTFILGKDRRVETSTELGRVFYRREQERRVGMKWI